MYKKIKLDEQDKLRIRVADCKAEMPDVKLCSLVNLFTQKFRKYKTYKQMTRVKNVFALIIVDAVITDELEIFTKEFLTNK